MLLDYKRPLVTIFSAPVLNVCERGLESFIQLP